MKNGFRRLVSLLLIVLLTVGLLPMTAGAADAPITEPQAIVDYLAQHGKLPDNFITKAEARKRGWDNAVNYLSDVAPGCSIGGDTFGNREKLLPEAKGRKYYECDAEYRSGKRNGKRVVYSSDGLYYYTADGYKTFTQLYPTKTSAKPVDPVLAAAQEVADYLFMYGELPSYFITKRQAESKGWNSSYNYVSDVAPGCAIGGDRFGNYEGALPTAKGRQYYECDCYYTSGKRNAYRVVFSNDGLVYYTFDHYETFTQMFPSWE